MTLPNIVDLEEIKELLLSHQKANKILREDPLPWSVGHSKLGGRGLFATRNIEPNELIFIDAPLLIGPKYMGNKAPMCVCCYKNECPLFPCDHGCGLPVCSEQCENSPKHVDYECKYLRSLVPTCGTNWSLDLLLAVIAIRGLFLTELQRKCLAAFQWDQSHAVCHELELLQRNVANPPSEEDRMLMKRICKTLNINAFETVSVQDKDHSSSLRGLYPIGGLQNHCCVPNTRHHFDGEQRLYVNAARPISAGEELTMSYTSLFWDTMLRRHFLSATKYFSCECKRCSDRTEFGSGLGAFLCASEDCSGRLLPQNPLNTATPWGCDKCSVVISNRQISSIRSSLSVIMENVLHKTPREIYNFMQRELSLVIPATNYLVMDIKFRIISYYGRAEGVEWAGLILYELYCTNMEKMKRIQQQRNIANDHAHFSIQNDENERLLKEAMTILQNDVVAAVTFEYDKKFFK
nr:SET domain-containing protein SmydA-8-like isoform X2 [Nomia melanderi]